MFASWQESYDKPRQCVDRQRRYSTNKGPIVKAMDFPLVRYGCETCSIKKAKCQRIDAFKLWCWRTLLRVPWTATRSNQSILREINPEYLLEGLMLKLKLQDFWSSDVHSWLTEKVRDAGKDWGQKDKRASEDEIVGWHHQCSECEIGQTLGDGEGQRGLVCCSPWGRKELDVTGQLNNSNN